MQLLYLNPHHLERDPDGVREDDGDVSGLAQTIRDQGLLQPLGVIATARERYRVVYGGRRLGAALQLGLERVPCILLENDEHDLLVRQLIENVQRQDLNDLEKARAFRRLREQFADQPQRASEGELDEQVAGAVGLAARTVRRYLGLLDLPPEIQQMIRDEELNVTQAQHLRRISNSETQTELARHAADEGLSAAEVSKLVNYFVANADLSLATALDALHGGQELRTTVPRAGAELPAAPGSLPGASAPGQDDDDPGEEDEGDEQPFGQFVEAEDPSRTKARVFRLKSLDQMVDETDRLARALHEGDVRKWIDRDENAAFKIRLLVKQLRSLSQELEALAGQQGWPL